MAIQPNTAADVLDWSNTNQSGFTRPGGPGGGGSTPRYTAGPPQPQNVRVRLISVGNFLMSWTDLPPSANTGVRAFWMVFYTSKDVAGSQTSQQNWSTNTYKGGQRIASVDSTFSGGTISVSFSLPNQQDGYVQVVGYFVNSNGGVPSVPILLNFEGNLNLVPGNVLSASMVVSKERVPYDVLRLDATYTPPADLTLDYGGAAVYMVGYNAGTIPQEFTMDQWDHSTGNQLATFRLPIETGQGSGTATFTNGSGGVLGVTGTAFSAGWVGRKFLVDVSSTSSQVYQVSAFTDGTHLTITPTFTGTNGTYSWKALNAVTFYFVSVGTSGARVIDYTTAVSTSI